MSITLSLIHIQMCIRDRTRKTISDSKTSLEKDKKNLVTMQTKQQTDKSQLESPVASKQSELYEYEDLLEQNEASSDALDREIKAQEEKVAQAKIAAQATQAPTQARCV